MDGQEYLDRISAKNQPQPKRFQRTIFGARFFWVGAIGIVAFIIIAILGAVLRGAGGKGKDKCFELLAHLGYTSEIVSEYQPSVKSSDLRSSSASFYGVLSNTNAELTNYITEKYKTKDATKAISKKISDQAQLEKNDLDEELFEAKINGILDRVYANKITYEISMLMTQEDDLYNTTKDESLKAVLTKSYDSLKNLYDKFDGFSEVK
jgi:hypothetical protein